MSPYQDRSRPRSHRCYALLLGHGIPLLSLGLVWDAEEALIARTVFWGCTGTIAIRDSVANVLVPFILGLASQKSNDDHGHIIATNTPRLAVRCQAVVHHVFTYLGKLLFRGDATSDKLDDSLRGLTIPDAYSRSESWWTVNGFRKMRTIASNDEKLIIIGDGVGYDVGEGSNDLLFW